MNVAILVQETETQPVCSQLVMDKLIANAKYSVYHLQTLNKEFECALKIFPKNKESYLSFSRENKIISHLDHENIIKPVSNVRFNTQTYDCYFLPMEFAPHGDFFDFIFSQELDNEKLVRTYFAQLVEAIEYLHSKGIAHLDLKLENMLIGNDYKLKLADFDQSQLLSEKTLLYRGSPSFRAPEMINKTCKNFAAADIYSLGIILFALATGDFPFLEKEGEDGFTLVHYDLFCENNETFWDLRTGHRTDKNIFNETFKEIINGLLTKDPVKRWTIEEIKKSRWYKGEILSDKELRKIMEQKVKGKYHEK